MLVMPATTENPCGAAPLAVAVGPDTLGRLAARALRDEAILTPKPGLVDLRGGNAHDDMDVETLVASADALADPITRCAEAALSAPLGPRLRARIRGDRPRRRAPHA